MQQKLRPVLVLVTVDRTSNKTKTWSVQEVLCTKNILIHCFIFGCCEAHRGLPVGFVLL